MIICIGEILADLIGRTQEGIVSYEMHAGGAPFNVACAVKKFGGKSGFYGVVGNDIVGDYLVDFAKKRSFDVLQIDKSENYNTTLAFVNIDQNGEREFCFYRKNTADYRLSEENILAVIKPAEIVHFGSLPLNFTESRDCVFSVMKQLKNTKKISFDFNYRKDLFQDDIDALIKALDYADIIKLSEDELYLITKEPSLSKALDKLQYNDKIVVITLGKRGSVCKYNELFLKADSINIKPVDTTGAGDAFFAGFLSILDKEKDYSKETLLNALKFGNVCGAITATKKGAITALPDAIEIEEALKILEKQIL